MVYEAAVTKKIDFKRGNRFLPFPDIPFHRMTRPYQQRAVYAVRCDSIGSGELPLWEDRLNNFQSMSNPIHAR